MNLVKELRERAGIQQKEIAVAVGVSRPTVSEWEHQKKDPSGERLIKLAEFFGVGTGVILGYDPIPGTAVTPTPMTDEEREIWEMREAMRREPDRKKLLYVAQHADIEEVRQANAILDALKKTRGDE